MKTFFLGIIFYFIISIPTQLILTSVFAMDASEDRWFIWGITLLVVIVTGLIWELFKYLRGKPKESSNT